MQSETQEEPSPSSPSRMIVIVVAALIVVGGAGYVFWIRPGDQPADYYTMRQYILSRMTDQQIRDLHEQAKVETENERMRAAAEGEEFWKEKSEDLQKCRSDVAFRERNPQACRLPLLVNEIGKPVAGRRTTEETFEGLLMGPCGWNLTIREARRFKCLP